MVEEHHGVEDSFLFPELERLTGKPNIAESEKAAHEGLHEGLERLKEYTERTMGDGSGYAWEGEGGLREVIDGFTGEFRKHLGDEVDMLMSLKSCDSEELWRVWNAMEDHIKAMKMEHVFVSIFDRHSVRSFWVADLAVGCNHADVHGLL